MSAGQPDDLVEVGRVLGTHGVRGWLRIATEAGQHSVVHEAPVLWLARRDQPPIPFNVEQRKAEQGKGRLHAVQGGTVLFCLSGLDNPEDAHQWQGSRVLVPRSAFPPPDHDEFYWIDLLGCSVFNAAGVALGEVTGVDDHGGGPFLSVGGVDESGTRRSDSLIPFVPVYVLSVDVVARRIVVDWDPAWN